MQAASEGKRAHTGTSSVKESESAVGLNVQIRVKGKGWTKERTSRDRQDRQNERERDREEASWRAIFVGAQTRLLHWILFCAANNCKPICTVSRRTVGRGRFVI